MAQPCLRGSGGGAAGGRSGHRGMTLASGSQARPATASRTAQLGSFRRAALYSAANAARLRCQSCLRGSSSSGSGSCGWA
eukprot:scaffold57442_cov70-Phaeocystis_antarctica.AAC.6